LLNALLWGLAASSSLIIGASVGVVWRWNRQLVYLILGFGAGALVASVSLELAAEGIRVGGYRVLAVGIAVGAITFYAADLGLQRLSDSHGQGGTGAALALGALLDGLPEQAVLGIGMARGEGVSTALFLAIFISNVPEAIGSATSMKESGTRPRTIVALWSAVAVLTSLACVGGHALQDVAGNALQGGLNGFAAGALLVMLVGQMVPEAGEKAHDDAGLAAVLGFALATGLSITS
jgi:zinc transporter, ZIP family